MYFFWVKNFRGQWAPAKAASRPTEKRSDGSHAFPFKGVVELSGEECSFSLKELAKKYPCSQ